MQCRNHHNSILNSVTYRIANCIIDPGDVWEGFMEVSTVLLTHAHFDHIYGLDELLDKSPMALVYTNAVGREMLLNAKKNMSYYHGTPFVFKTPDRIRLADNGQEIDIGNGLLAKAVYTPGHNPSCVTWVIGDMVFSGDSLIPGVKTVTNLPGGNKLQAFESERIIRKLAVARSIYPGHKI